MAQARIKNAGRNTPPHPEHGSYVIGCTEWGGAGRVPCLIDWDAPDEQDEIDSESTQCVNFWCATCDRWKLCSTRQRR